MTGDKAEDMRPPGWYTNPSGPGIRYWDGTGWTDHVTDTAPKTGLSAGWIGFFIGIACFLGIGACVALSGSSGSHVSPDEAERTAIETCQGSIRNQLRDPNSAEFSDWKAWPSSKVNAPNGMAFRPEDGDRLYYATGMANAKNGFGGYVGDQRFTCDAVVQRNGDSVARATKSEPSP